MDSKLLNFVVINETPQAENMLRKPAKKLDFPLSSEILALIEAMKRKVIDEDGVGLAASQIGHHLQLLIYHVPPDSLVMREDAIEAVPLSVLINGSYTPMVEEGMFSDWEGCFSVNGTIGKVPRYKCISYEGYTADGKPVKATARGFLARVLQHEIDHTQGILFIDRLTADSVQGPTEEMMKIRREELKHKITAQQENTAQENKENKENE